MFKISKEVDFCYGHRVWSQQLHSEFSQDKCLACRRIHGHQGKLTVSLESKGLEYGMVTDFKHLNWLKKLIDDKIDHKLILDKNDPYLPSFLGSLTPANISTELSILWNLEPERFWTLKYNNIGNLEARTQYCWHEILEGTVIVDFVPTSENLSKFFYNICYEKMKKLGVTVTSVKFNETPKTSAEYYG